ncbi:GNAT family N-acetyltransferase [Nocardia carnea]|uniref:GNAT family N-acetyltransferase n=1 Tax=Nocardia carnea TaxID=37328 RepID=A0ABW7TGW8_9NOCA|nr:GNAT family N-acetyltransferase [Nocardia carnea]
MTAGASSWGHPVGGSSIGPNSAAQPGSGPLWQIVPLAPAHAHALAVCHIACWREAYQGLVPEHVLAALDTDRRAATVERIARHPTGTILVAESGSEVIGFVHYGPPSEYPAAAERELGALYVRAPWYGTGLAQALLDAVLEPDKSCSLWVFEQNPRARAFYGKYGFVPDGTARAERFATTTEIRLVRPAVECRS